MRILNKEQFEYKGEVFRLISDSTLDAIGDSEFPIS